VIGVLLGPCSFVGGLVAREIDPIRAYIVSVLEFANYGALWLVALITVVNGVAEEMFFAAPVTPRWAGTPRGGVDARLRRRGVRGGHRCWASQASSRRGVRV